MPMCVCVCKYILPTALTGGRVGMIYNGIHELKEGSSQGPHNSIKRHHASCESICIIMYDNKYATIEHLAESDVGIHLKPPRYYVIQFGFFLYLKKNICPLRSEVEEKNNWFGGISYIQICT